MDPSKLPTSPLPRLRVCASSHASITTNQRRDDLFQASVTDGADEHQQAFTGGPYLSIEVGHTGLSKPHLGNPRPVSLSRSALEVLAIVAYRQSIARSGIEHIRGSSSDSALDTLLQRGLVVHNEHHLLVTTRARKTPRF